MNRSTAFTTSSVVGITALAGFFCVSQTHQADAVGTPVSSSPASVQLTGVVRDFKESNKAGGHPDFETDSEQPDKGFGVYNGNISANLGADQKPVFTGAGYLATSPYKDSSNRAICYTLYDPAQGDHAGVKGANSKGGIKNETSFNSWFRDNPSYNMSKTLTITLNKAADGSYVFDDKLDPTYQNLSGFFPIEGQLYGNEAGSPNRNFHFTFELHTQFTYKAGQNQTFKFIGDDDVWVFINNKLVIDLGGVHSAQEQFVSLDRLGLTHNKKYNLDFFYAERHRTQANCRIQTNLVLQSTDTPSTTAAFD
ncbi:MAG TPA: fibro-slime domain-containing protein [Phycisphaerales bacterium]|nr:fibro-slime domain-containing protein [Phycisphaerales bacterium]